MELRYPTSGPPWLRDFGASIVRLLKGRLSAPLWLWSAPAVDLPATPELGANQGAIAHDETANRPAFHDGAGWITLMPFTPGAALTRANDTNVTLTLGGSPTSALLAATSLTLGWTGTLAVARGGTGSATAAGAATNLGLGTGDSPTFAAITTTGAATVKGNLNLWGGNAALAGGITANSAGGGLYLYASGTNQNIRLVPSGTGFVQATSDLAVSGQTILSGNLLLNAPGLTIHAATGDVYLRAGTGGSLRLGANGTNSLAVLSSGGMAFAGGAITGLSSSGTAVGFTGRMLGSSATAGLEVLNLAGVSGAKLIIDNGGANLNLIDGTTTRIRTSAGTTIAEFTSSGLTMTGFVSASGAIGGATFYLGSNQLAGVSGSYHMLYTSSGNIAMYLGNSADQRNYYDNAAHQWRSVGGATTYGTLDTSGLTISTASNFQGTIKANANDGSYSSFGWYVNGVAKWSIYEHPGASDAMYWANAAGLDRMMLTQGGGLTLLVAGSYLRTVATTVSGLPSASVGAGARAFVTDATATTFASVVAGGGANGVPVYSDGANWRIG